MAIVLPHFLLYSASLGRMANVAGDSGKKPPMAMQGGNATSARQMYYAF